MTRPPFAPFAAFGVLLLAVAPALPARGADSVQLILSRTEVVPNEQIVLWLRVAHARGEKPQWEEPPFEGFWTERLRALGDARGEGVQTTVRRALFPSRVGTLAIAPSRLRIEDPEGNERFVRVPGAEIVVRPLPADGRPPGFTGVVGKLNVSVDVRESEITLGEAVPLTINVFGDANVWDAELPRLDELLGEDVEVFPGRPRVLKSEHGGTLRTRRIYPIELVPRRAGTIAIPALEIPYFDRDERAYRIAVSEPTAFRARTTRAASRAPWENPAPLPPPPSPVRLWVLLAAAAAALAAGGAAVSWWWRASLARLRQPPAPRPRDLLARAEAAEATDAFPELLRDALRAGIHVRHRLDPRPLTTDELAARVEDPDAIALLRALDELRFTGAPDRTRDLLARVRDYVAPEA